MPLPVRPHLDAAPRTRANRVLYDVDTVSASSDPYLEFLSEEPRQAVVRDPVFIIVPVPSEAPSDAAQDEPQDQFISREGNVPADVGLFRTFFRRMLLAPCRGAVRILLALYRGVVGTLQALHRGVVGALLALYRGVVGALLALYRGAVGTLLAVRRSVVGALLALHRSVMGTLLALHRSVMGTLLALHRGVMGTLLAVHRSVMGTLLALRRSVVGALQALHRGVVGALPALHRSVMGTFLAVRRGVVGTLLALSRSVVGALLALHRSVMGTFLALHRSVMGTFLALRRSVVGALPALHRSVMGTLLAVRRGVVGALLALHRSVMGTLLALHRSVMGTLLALRRSVVGALPALHRSVMGTLLAVRRGVVGTLLALRRRVVATYVVARWTTSEVARRAERSHAGVIGGTTSIGISGLSRFGRFTGDVRTGARAISRLSGVATGLLRARLTRDIRTSERLMSMVGHHLSVVARSLHERDRVSLRVHVRNAQRLASARLGMRMPSRPRLEMRMPLWALRISRVQVSVTNVRLVAFAAGTAACALVVLFFVLQPDLPSQSDRSVAPVPDVVASTPSTSDYSATLAVATSGTIPIKQQRTAPRSVSAPMGVRSASMTVRSTPAGARVTINGIGWGETPVTIRYLPPGQKVVRVTKEGYESQQRIISVSDDSRSANVRVTLRAPRQRR